MPLSRRDTRATYLVRSCTIPVTDIQAGVKVEIRLFFCVAKILANNLTLTYMLPQQNIAKVGVHGFPEGLEDSERQITSEIVVCQ